MLTHIYTAMLMLASPSVGVSTAATKAPLASRVSPQDVTSPHWQPVLRLVEKGDKAVQDGVRNVRHTVRSRKMQDQAIAYYAAASRQLLDVLSKHGDDREMRAEARQIAQRIKDGVVAADVFAANALTVQTSYRKALDRAGRALASDPSNADAKALIHTIQMAQVASGGWGAAPGVAQPAR